MQTRSLQSLLQVTAIKDAVSVLAAHQKELQKQERMQLSSWVLYHAADLFDSEFFKDSVGKIIDVLGEGVLTDKEIKYLGKHLPYAYTSARLSQQYTSLIQRLLSNGWVFLDSVVDLVAQPDKIPIKEKLDRDFSLAQESYLPSLLQCASNFRYGRLFSDPLFLDGTALYRAWIENSVRHKVADRVYVLAKDSYQIDGFLTIREHTLGSFRYWEVPLVGKHPESIREHVAYTLLDNLLAVAATEGCRVVCIGTHGNNIAALRSYAKAGFRPFDCAVTMRYRKPGLAKHSQV